MQLVNPHCFVATVVAAPPAAHRSQVSQCYRLKLRSRRQLTGSVLCSGGGGSTGLVAKDALGNTVTQSGWLAAHQNGDHSLVQGLKVRDTRT
jgi:hypothetical protein